MNTANASDRERSGAVEPAQDLGNVHGDPTASATPLGFDGYVAIVRRRWVPVAACVAIAFVASIAITASAADTYRSSARLFVNIPSSRGVQESLQGVQLSSQLLGSYAEIATSRDTSAAVADRLNGRFTPAEVRSHLSATPRPDTLLIDVSATASDPADARDLANAGAASLAAAVAELEAGKSGAVEAKVIDEAVANPTPVAPSAKKNLAEGLLLGLVAGVFLALLIDALSRSASPAPTAAAGGADETSTAGALRSLTDAVTATHASVEELSFRIAAVEEQTRPITPRRSAARNGATR